jgi:hypothetical protein
LGHDRFLPYPCQLFTNHSMLYSLALNKL